MLKKFIKIAIFLKFNRLLHFFDPAGDRSFVVGKRGIQRTTVSARVARINFCPRTVNAISAMPEEYGYSNVGIFLVHLDQSVRSKVLCFTRWRPHCESFFFFLPLLSR